MKVGDLYLSIFTEEGDVVYCRNLRRVKHIIKEDNLVIHVQYDDEHKCEVHELEDFEELYRPTTMKEVDKLNGVFDAIELLEDNGYEVVKNKKNG